MTAAAWLALAVVASMVAALALTRHGTDVIFMGGLTVLLVAGVVSPPAAFAGFANPGVVTIAALYVVVAGLEETGAVERVAFPLFGAPRTDRQARRRLLPFAAAMSAVLNNTPVVAVLIPVVGGWARRWRIPASRVLLPLSYAAILGGTCTLVGSSTNLVVNGLLIERGGGLRLLELAWVGVPVTLVGLAYLLLAAPRLLPDRGPAPIRLDDPREYAVEMVVEAGSPLVGRTIEEAGLRHLAGVYLAEIGRGGRVLPAVAPTETLEAGDRLVFVGVVDSIVDLQRMPGLVPATDQVFKLDAPRPQRQVVEAVVSEACRLVGRSIREGRFRTVYNAVVLAVARGGERVRAKVGDIVLRPGDTLLLEAPPGFLERYRHSREFYLVSPVDAPAPPRRDRAPVAAAVLAAMVIAAAVGAVPVVVAALVAAAAMVGLRCTSASAARQMVDWPVLVAIAAAIGVAGALEASGAAAALARLVQAVAGPDPWLDLALVYGFTSLLTLVVTNNAAAVLAFPVAAALAADLGASLTPFAVAVMVAASASFATPIGYQTNLMVQGPGGYRPGDYLRAGIPLTLITAAVALALIPRVWPF